jgi:hypothetical protein
MFLLIKTPKQSLYYNCIKFGIFAVGILVIGLITNDWQKVQTVGSVAILGFLDFTGKSWKKSW